MTSEPTINESTPCTDPKVLIRALRHPKLERQKAWYARIDAANLIEKLLQSDAEKDPEQRIPHGWRFYTSDFSVSPGSVMLRRDEEGLAWFHKLSDEEKETAVLYVWGQGSTINEAIDNAVSQVKK